MDPTIAQRRDEEVADFLWRAITKVQAMTDRLLAQCGSSLRGQGADAFSLSSLEPA